MCGIAGYAGQGDRAVLERMILSIAYRGPDARAHWTDESQQVGLAHARLSVVDLEGGAQPMWSLDGQLGVVFNGEIYNFQELRRELEASGCIFQTDHSDTEVLLHGYRTWGDGFVRRLNGMWAFVILDRNRRRLFASRDRFGKKPFYYRHHDHGLVFASEARALRQHEAGRTDVDSLSLRKYLCHGYVPEPRSLWRDVFKLPGGCNLSYGLADGRLAIERYWQFDLEPPTASASGPVEESAAQAQQLGELLEAAVARRLLADVPVGAFLSGGLDSSLVTAMAARHHAGRLMTFTIGFKEAAFDESAHARLVARHLGTEHVEERLEVDTALALIGQALGRMAEPSADSSFLPTYLVSQLARRHVTVALGGDGADELFAGYGPFHALRWARWVHGTLPGAAIRGLQGLAGLLPVSHAYMSLDFKIKRALAGLDDPMPLWLPRWMAPMTVDEANALIDDGCAADAAEVYSEAIHAWGRGAGAQPGSNGQTTAINGALQYFTDLYLRDGILAKVDGASMFNSLEVRSPFLDVTIADFARRLPVDRKFRGGKGKWLLRETARQYLPESVMARPKQGFAIPVGQWFKTGQLNLDLSKLPPQVRPDRAAALQHSHRAGRRDERLSLWALLALGFATSGDSLPG